jgi:hypothetical protein
VVTGGGASVLSFSRNLFQPSQSYFPIFGWWWQVVSGGRWW